MLYFILILQSILGWSFLFNRFLKRDYSFSLPLVASSITAVAYYMNLFGLLKPTYYIIYYSGLGLFFAFLADSIINKRIRDYFTSDIVVFCVVAFVGYLRFTNSYYFQWDNFTNWGIAVKELNIFDGFSPDQNLVRGQYAEYPNGSAVFIYFITKTLGFSEGNAMFGHFLLFLMFASALLIKNRPLHTTCLLLVAITLGAVCNPGIGSLYVDGMVGAVAGALAIAYIQSHKKSYGDYLLLVPFFIAVPAIKQVGLVLVVILSCIIFIDIFFVRNEKKTFHYFSLIILLTVTLVTADSWPHLSPYSSGVYNLPSFYKKLHSAFHNILGTENFYKVVFGLVKGVARTLKSTFMIVALLSIFIPLMLSYKYDKKIFHAHKHAVYSVLCGVIFYLGHRLVLYMSGSAFSLHEAFTATSLKRFTGSYIMIACFVSLFYLKTLSATTKTVTDSKKYWKILIAICLVLSASRLYSKPRFLPFDEDRSLVLEETSYLIQHKPANVFVLPDNFTQHHCALYYMNTSFSGIYMNSGLCFDGSRFNDHGKTDEAMDEYKKLLIADNFNIERGKDPNKYDMLFIPRPSDRLWKELEGNIYIATSNRSKKLFIRCHGNVFVPVLIKNRYVQALCFCAQDLF